MLKVLLYVGICKTHNRNASASWYVTFWFARFHKVTNIQIAGNYGKEDIIFFLWHFLYRSILNTCTVSDMYVVLYICIFVFRAGVISHTHDKYYLLNLHKYNIKGKLIGRLSILLFPLSSAKLDIYIYIIISVEHNSSNNSRKFSVLANK